MLTLQETRNVVTAYPVTCNVLELALSHNVTLQLLHALGGRVTVRRIREYYTKVFEQECMLPLVESIRDFDSGTFEHSVHVCTITMVIANIMGYGTTYIINAGRAAILHDIGKTKLNILVLNKKSKLTDEEFSDIQRHTYSGYSILSAYSELDVSVAQAALNHHERLDGSGYPHGLSKSAIMDTVRIVMIADVVDALTSERCYRTAMSPSKVLEHLQRYELDRFDQEVMQVLDWLIRGKSVRWLS
jgi:putative nucleotidyltransferase with HDIG domain